MRWLRTVIGILLFWLPAQLLGWLLGRLRAKPKVVARLRLAGTLEEEPGGRRRLGSGSSRTTVIELRELLQLASEDPSVRAIAVRVGSLTSGWAEVEELRQAVLQLRKTGRKAFAYLENPGHLEYFLGSAFDHLVAPPMAGLDLVGLRAEVTFYKGTLDLLGVTAHFEAAGEYKSFAEPFLREGMSEPFRESLDGVLSEVHGRFIQAVAEGRGLGAGQVQELIDRGPWTAREARDAGLIDRTLYPDRWKRAIERELDGRGADDDEAATEAPSGAGDGVVAFVPARSHLRPWGWLRWLRHRGMPGPRIAVVLASGPIGSADGGDSAPGRIAWRALSKTIRAVRKDPRVHAVVLRIDSPGGSGAASDLLWRELKRLAKEKPVVASMGSVAASGGYYLAMAADAIVASPMTITGSIGVVGGKVDLTGLLRKIGVTREVLSYGEHTGLMSLTEGMSEGEREHFRALLRTFYDEFVSKAAEGRKVPAEELEVHARGRIWTGSQALDRGLVDRVGTLRDAQVEAARRAGLGEGWETWVYTAPRPGWLVRLRQQLSPLSEASVSALLREPLGWSPGEDSVQARLPYDLRIR